MTPTHKAAVLRWLALVAAVALLATSGNACGGGNLASGPTPVTGAGYRFNSFHYTVDAIMQVRDSDQAQIPPFNVSVVGDYSAPDSHSFASKFEFGRSGFSWGAVIIGADAWYRESGGVWRATRRDAADIQNALVLTSAAPGFLSYPHFATDLLGVTSQLETIDGVETRRYHISKGDVQALSRLFGSAFGNDSVAPRDSDVTIWLEEKTGGLIRAELAGTASPGILGANAPVALSPAATVAVHMTINLSQINSSGIAVKPPVNNGV